ncbi:hypothetical protein [Halalkalibacter krulwichiae]
MKMTPAQYRGHLLAA